MDNRDITGKKSESAEMPSIENQRDSDLESMRSSPEEKDEQATKRNRPVSEDDRPKKQEEASSAVEDTAIESGPQSEERPPRSQSTDEGIEERRSEDVEHTSQAQSGGVRKRKRRPKDVEHTSQAQSADVRKRKRRPKDVEHTSQAQSADVRKRKRRPKDVEHTSQAQSADVRKRKRRPEGVEHTSQAQSADVRKRKRRPEGGEHTSQAQSGDVRKRKRRPKDVEHTSRAQSADGRKRKRRPEGAERISRRRSSDGTEGRQKSKKKRTYMDVLSDLVVDNSMLALLIKGLFCLLLFIIVLFVARGIRNKTKAPRQDMNENMEADESNLSSAQTDLQRKTESFLNAGAGAQEENSITILGVGDNLAHEQVFLSAKTADGYDFRPFYANVKSFIASADLATVNQETPLATALGSPSGYPHFNTPTEMGDALIDTGFDVANMGNNHMFDMGVDGAYVTREYWDEQNIPCTGFYYGYDDLFDFRIIEKKGIKVAFLSFVEMTNDELPSDYSAIVVYMNDPDIVRSLIEEAKENADIVVVHAHWGDENTDVTNDYVYNEAQKLVNWGADIVFGNHSHVVQDLVTLTRESDGQKCPVIYSLGNFFSAQKVRDQLVSGMLTVQVTKDASGKVRPSAMGFLPIVTHYTGDRSNLSLYPLNMYSDEMAKMHGTASVSSEGLPMSMDYIESLLEAHIPVRYLGKMGTIQ